MTCKNCGVELVENPMIIELKGKLYDHSSYIDPNGFCYCEIASKRQHRYIPHIPNTGETQ